MKSHCDLMFRGQLRILSSAIDAQSFMEKYEPHFSLFADKADVRKVIDALAQGADPPSGSLCRQVGQLLASDHLLCVFSVFVYQKHMAGRMRLLSLLANIQRRIPFALRHSGPPKCKIELVFRMFFSLDMRSRDMPS